jgi:DNA-directed RNA polymerase specialized sigma subunit
MTYPSNEEILRVVSECLPTKTISPELATIFIQLTQRMAYKPNFRGFPEQEDMAQDALAMLCRTWHHFDPSKSNNPFAYFTQCIHGSFLGTLHRIKRDRAVT